MNTNTGFILKVFLMSIALSLAIKYGGPILSIPSTNLNALIAVFTPSIILATILGWRAFQQQ
jgi:membrane protein implicated in regulation of membrane protease activity